MGAGTLVMGTFYLEVHLVVVVVRSQYVFVCWRTCEKMGDEGLIYAVRLLLDDAVSWKAIMMFSHSGGMLVRSMASLRCENRGRQWYKRSCG